MTTPTPQELVSRALAAEAAGDAAGAAASYDALVAQGFANGPLLHNQGNAHLRAGDLPRAILAYRQAERLMPHDPRLHANLADARAQVIDPPATPATWFLWPSVQTQLFLMVMLWVLGWCLAIMAVLRPRRLLVLLASGAIVAALALGSLVAFDDWREAAYPLAVVSQDAVPLRQGNGTSYPPVLDAGVPIKLNRGVELRLLHERPNGWFRVALADGRTGWVKQDQVLTAPR
jgi:tetratricopeptide (TPR) repeat protein